MRAARGAALGETRHPARAFSGYTIAVRRVEVKQLHLAEKLAFTGPALSVTVAIISVGVIFFKALAAGDAFVTNLGIVERGPNLLLRSGNPLPVVHLHGQYPYWLTAARQMGPKAYIPNPCA